MRYPGELKKNIECGLIGPVHIESQCFVEKEAQYGPITKEVTVRKIIVKEGAHIWSCSSSLFSINKIKFCVSNLCGGSIE